MSDPMVDASQALTLTAELDPAQIGALRLRLREIDEDIAGDNHRKKRRDTHDMRRTQKNPGFLPGALPDTHFTRFVIVEDSATEARHRLPPLLVWESNHDGDTRAYLAACYRAAHHQLARAAPADAEPHGLDFDLVFGACRGYPSLRTASEAQWVSWMAARTLPADAFYCGYRGVAKRHVDAAGRVHEALRHYLDRERASLVGLPAEEVHARLVAHVSSTPPPAPMHPGDLTPIPRRDPFTDDPRLRRALRRLLVPVWVPLLVLWLGLGAAGVWLTARWWSRLLAVGGAALAALLVVGVTFWLAWKYLLWKERRDKPEPIKRPVHGKSDLIAAEDRIVQNQLTHLVDLKPGPFRYFVQKLVLRAIDLLARFVYLDGDLGGITSIHFGRWVVLKDRRWWRFFRRRHRLLFFSNYDFSWDSYLGEFIDRQATGLTAVWSNTEGFPRTHKLIKDGARDEERFKQWTRNRQIASQVWWSGVRTSSVENVGNDVAIHRGLTTRPYDLTRWLRRL